jgi:hypothetical protein
VPVPATIVEPNSAVAISTTAKMRLVMFEAPMRTLPPDVFDTRLEGLVCALTRLVRLRTRFVLIGVDSQGPDGRKLGGGT